MPNKFHGSIDELKMIVKFLGIHGKWRSDGSKQVFRSVDGGILNWWENGTIQFQGKEKSRLERLVQKAIIANESKLKVDSVIQGGSVTGIPLRAQFNSLEENSELAALLSQVKKALSDLAMIIVRINDLIKVMSETEYNHCRSLVQRGSEVYIREL